MRHHHAHHALRVNRYRSSQYLVTASLHDTAG